MEDKRMEFDGMRCQSKQYSETAIPTPKARKVNNCQSTPAILEVGRGPLAGCGRVDDKLG